VAYDRESTINALNEFLEQVMNVIPKLPFWQSVNSLQQFFLQETEKHELFCRNAVYRESLKKKLQESKYDVMVIDPVAPCGELVAELLQVPFVNTLRGSVGSTTEKYSGNFQFHLPMCLSPREDLSTE
jgi:glucuronosyltransferase